MSHANGQVRFNDGTIMHYEYDGTADIVCNALYETHEEMNANWRNQPTLSCTCREDEPVQLANDYASGHHWDGRACRHCRAITQGTGADSDTAHDQLQNSEEQDGLPGWWAQEDIVPIMPLEIKMTHFCYNPKCPQRVRVPVGQQILTRKVPDGGFHTKEIAFTRHKRLSYDGNAELYFCDVCSAALQTFLIRYHQIKEPS